MISMTKYEIDNQGKIADENYQTLNLSEHIVDQNQQQPELNDSNFIANLDNKHKEFK